MFCVTVPNFMRIAHTVAETSQFFTFFLQSEKNNARRSRFIEENFVFCADIDMQ